jgi:hypothetical protein
MSKYHPLRDFLETRGGETVPMTFAEIERVLGFKLPRSQTIRAWWSNNPSNNVMTKEWLAAGYKTESVDLEGRKLVFRRVKRLAGQAATPKAGAVGDSAAEKRRHPLFGVLKGWLTILPGTDLTAPADPEWADIAWGAESDSKVGRKG